MNQKLASSRHRGARMSGVGLLEVIICTGLVALMIVPLAGVIRASGQSIAETNGEGSVQNEMRQGLRYLSNTIRQGEVTRIRWNRISIRMPNGRTAVARVRGGKLELQEGRQRMVLAEDVRRVRFRRHRQRSGARATTGVEIRLIARDPVTRRWARVNAAVAFPPQV